MLTNALASILSTSAEKFYDLPIKLPVALEVGKVRGFTIVFFTAPGSFNLGLVLSRGAFFFCQPAEEAALVLWDGLSVTMEMSLPSISLLLLLLLI
jgi:hypothetical protein